MRPSTTCSTGPSFVSGPIDAERVHFLNLTLAHQPAARVHMILICLLVLLGLLLLGTSTTPIRQAVADSSAAKAGDMPGKTTGMAGDPAALTCDPDWQIVPSANAVTSPNYLNAIDAVSAVDIWAVGHYRIGTRARMLALHWDGF